MSQSNHIGGAHVSDVIIRHMWFTYSRDSRPSVHFIRPGEPDDRAMLLTVDTAVPTATVIIDDRAVRFRLAPLSSRVCPDDPVTIFYHRVGAAVRAYLRLDRTPFVCAAASDPSVAAAMMIVAIAEVTTAWRTSSPTGDAPRALIRDAISRRDVDTARLLSMFDQATDAELASLIRTEVARG